SGSRAPDVCKAGVKRCETETQDVRRAEIANDAAGDQRLDNRISVLMRQRDLASALRFRSWRDAGEPVLHEPLVGKLHEQAGEGERFFTQCVDVGALEYAEAFHQRQVGQDRRGAAPELLDRGGRLKVDLEREWCGMTLPSGQRIAGAVQMPLRDIEPCGRARPAVEIFVRAADREVG